jgi:hypothetical protein
MNDRSRRYSQYPALCLNLPAANAMSNLPTTSLGYLSPVGDYALKNTQALGGVSQLWQDFFSRALEDQLVRASTDVVEPASVTEPQVEPTAGGELLAHIKTQRACDLQGVDVLPGEPLFLPLAEFDLQLLDKAALPFAEQELAAQQKQLDFDNGWVRPLVLNAGCDPAEPGPAPRPRALSLPIAEFSWELADPPAVPFDEPTLVRQQIELQFDHHWAAPVVLQNVRLTA